VPKNSVNSRQAYEILEQNRTSLRLLLALNEEQLRRLELLEGKSPNLNESFLKVPVRRRVVETRQALQDSGLPTERFDREVALPLLEQSISVPIEPGIEAEITVGNVLAAARVAASVTPTAAVRRATGALGKIPGPFGEFIRDNLKKPTIKDLAQTCSVLSVGALLFAKDPRIIAGAAALGNVCDIIQEGG